MINKSNDVEKLTKDNKKQETTGKKPNESGSVYVMSHVKIFDPNTKEILVQIRGDH